MRKRALANHSPFLQALVGVGVLLLALGLALGALFGAAQVMRGAHYVSHVLWSAWICWTLSVAADALSQAVHGLPVQSQLAHRLHAHALRGGLQRIAGHDFVGALAHIAGP